MATSLPTRPGDAAPRRVARRRPMISSRTAWLLLAPSLALFFFVVLVPIGYTIHLSTRSSVADGGSLLGRRVEKFVGLENYLEAVTDAELWAGIGRMLLYSAILVPVLMGLALLFALILDSPGVRFRRFSRIAIFLPFAVPGVIASIMWGFLYLPGVSPFHRIAEAVGLPAPSFFAPDALFGSLANIGVWGAVGFNMIIIFTALQTIPAELSEAARIDGLNDLQISLRIKLPLVIPAILLTGMFTVIGALQLYTEPQTLQPLTTAISTSWVPLMSVYGLAFVTNDINQAAATSLFLAAMTFVASLAILRARGRKAAS